MDDQRDAETEKIDPAGRDAHVPQHGTDAPTEHIDPAERRLGPSQRGSANHTGSTRASARTEVLMREPPTFAWLVITRGPERGSIFQLSTSTTAIGRDHTNTIQLGDQYVSRSHAKIRAEEDEDGALQFNLYDQASTGGVFVNNQQVYRYPLQDGDRIEIGETVLVFKRPSKLTMEESDG